MQGDKDNVAGHQSEGDAREQDGGGDAENGKGVVNVVGDEELHHPDDAVEGVNEDEGYVEEAPQVLGVHLPAMLNDGGKLFQDPAGGKDVKNNLVYGHSARTVLVRVAVDHGEDVEAEEDGEVEQLYQVAELGDDEAAVVEDGGPAGVVERDGVVVIVVRENVDERQGRVDDFASMDSLDNPLTGQRPDQDLALGKDGQLEGDQFSLVARTAL